MEKILNAGYTLRVTSWENDGDNHETHEMVFQDKQMAITVANLCRTVFASAHNGENGIGNLSAEYDDAEASETILEHMKKFSSLYADLTDPTDDQIIETCMGYNEDLMGYSEFYFSRVFEKAVILYSPEDVFVEVVESFSRFK